MLRLRDRRVLPLRALTLGDADSFQAGQFVLTLSNPFAPGFQDARPSAIWDGIDALYANDPDAADLRREVAEARKK